jgi:hypothetical protein
MVNYFQNLWSQVDESCKKQPSLYQNNEAITLNELNNSSYKAKK